jgi:aquaporin Z
MSLLVEIGILSRVNGANMPLCGPLNQGSLVRALVLHWPEYLMEAAELGLFMMSACFFSVMLGYPGSPIAQLIHDPFLRRLLTGLAMAVTAISIIYSALGKQSGAHMNPALTLMFLWLKKIRPVDALFYIFAQFLGAISGVAISSLLLGMAVSDRAVRFAATQPGPSGWWTAFVAEAIISFVLVLTVLTVSNTKALSRYTPLFAGTLIAFYITFESPLSGMSMNPARTLGSAVFASSFDSLWIYFVAPPIGMLLAAQLFVSVRSASAVHCAKFHHDNSKRCIFRCTYAELAKAPATTSGHSCSAF